MQLGLVRHSSHRRDSIGSVIVNPPVFLKLRPKDPRATSNFKRGFVELGYYALKRLERKPIYEFHAWSPPQLAPRQESDPGKPRPNALRPARYYQSLLASGKFESRAVLARFLGVSRARVTQVLNRLKVSADIMSQASELCREAGTG